MIRFLSLFFVLFIHSLAQGQVLYRPEQIQDFLGFVDLTQVKNIYVPGAQVAWANYELLKKDFPHLKNKSNEQIQRWIIENFAYISEAQLKLGELRNTKIPLSKKHQWAHRQKTQGRGDTVTAYDDRGRLVGLVDRKGSGVTERGVRRNQRLLEWYRRHQVPELKIETRTSTNGLMTLSEGMMETVAERAIFEIFKRSPSQLPASTIGHYFLLSFPFDVKLNGYSEPAAILGRQAHIGRIWVGTNPFRDTNNIKQTDFFASYTDTGTATIRIPGFYEIFNPLTKVGDISRRFASDVIAKFRNGHVSAVQEHIDQSTEKIRQQLSQMEGFLPVAKPDYIKMNLQQALSMTLDWVLKDPFRYVRFTDVIFAAQQQGNQEVLLNEKVQKTILFLLSFDNSHIESDEIVRPRPLKEFGLRLLPALKSTDRTAFLKHEFTQRELQILSKVIWLIPVDEVKSLLPQIYQSAPQDYVMSLVRALSKEAKKTVAHPFLQNMKSHFQFLQKSEYSHLILKNDTKRVESLFTGERPSGMSCRKIFSF